MFFYVLLAIPLAFTWMAVTSSPTPGGFLVGFIASLVVLLCLRPMQVSVELRQVPGKILGIFIYVVILFRDIFMSSVDVARRALSRDMRLHPGIIAVPTQDAQQRDIVAALSAHHITITPGELVVEFEGSRTMYVHSLDVEASAPNAEAAQARRLELLEKIL